MTWLVDVEVSVLDERPRAHDAVAAEHIFKYRVLDVLP